MKITVRGLKRTKNKEDEKFANKILNDEEQEAWENGTLGRDVEHMQISDVTLSGKPTSIRLSDELQNKLKSLARKKGLSTHSYVRMVLIEHVEKQALSQKESR